MSSDAETSRLTRLKDRAVIKRDVYAKRIRGVHDLAGRSLNDAEESPHLLSAVDTLDALWSSFLIEDNAVLDYLIDLGLSSEYSGDLNVELSECVTYAKSVAARFRECANEQPNGSAYSESQPSIRQVRDNDHQSNAPFVTPAISDKPAPVPAVRLPEIPLPSFDGDIYKWPAFSDRFKSMVDQRTDLPDIDKVHYLVGCLKGNAVDTLRGIPISGHTYKLAWSTLESQYDKPRLVAYSLVETLLSAPRITNESLFELNKFMTAFDESISVLESLNIPNLGDFILFSMASRCLPVSVRTLFESQLTNEYPSVGELFTFVKY